MGIIEGLLLYGAILGLCVEKDSFRALIAHRNAWPPSWAQSNLLINTSRTLVLGRYLWGDPKCFILLIYVVINNPSVKYIIRASVLIIMYSRLQSNGTATFPNLVHTNCSPLFLNLLLAMQRPLILHLTLILAPVRSLPSTSALIRSCYCYGSSTNKPFPWPTLWRTASQTRDELMNRYEFHSVGCRSVLSIMQNKLIPWASNATKPPLLAICVLWYYFSCQIAQNLSVNTTNTCNVFPRNTLALILGLALSVMPISQRDQTWARGEFASVHGPIPHLPNSLFL